MDFIEQLPNSSGYDTILVIVDRLSKQGIFLPTVNTIGSEDLAQLFLQHVFAKHGAPGHISADRGSEFVSHFFRSLGNLLDIRMHYTSGYHPEANGQVERLNQTLEQYLRMYCSYQQSDWSDLLPLAEFAYNNAPHDSTGISPFYANKGYNPNIAVHPERDISSLRARDLAVDIHELHAALKKQIAAAQARYSLSANSRRTPPPNYEIGQLVYVDAENINTTRPTRKLAERFLGPFPIAGRAGPQSFQISFPKHLRGIHPVFHVSQLEPAYPNTIPNRIQEPPPPDIIDGQTEHEIAAVLDSKYDKRYRCPLRYFVRWAGYEGTPEEFEWIAASDMPHAKDTVEAFHAQHLNREGSYEEYLTFVE
jgi:hypothetical protein